MKIKFTYLWWFESWRGGNYGIKALKILPRTFLNFFFMRWYHNITRLHRRVLFKCLLWPGLLFLIWRGEGVWMYRCQKLLSYYRVMHRLKDLETSSLGKDRPCTDKNLMLRGGGGVSPWFQWTLAFWCLFVPSSRVFCILWSSEFV